MSRIFPVFVFTSFISFSFLFLYLSAAPPTTLFPTINYFAHLVPEAYPDGAEKFLLDSIIEDDLEMVRNFIEAGLDLNSRDASGNLYLNYAVTFRHTDLVQLLLSSGANPAFTDSAGRSALHYSVMNTNSPDMKIIALLFEYGADIFGRVHDTDFTFLDYAVIYGAIEAFETYRILSDADNIYFLDLALQHSKNIKIVFHLLARGVDPNYTTPVSKTTVLIHLVKNRCKVSDLKKLFNDYTITNIDSLDSEGLSALSHAGNNNNMSDIDIVRFLHFDMQAKVDPDNIPHSITYDRDAFIEELDEYEAGFSCSCSCSCSSLKDNNPPNYMKIQEEQLKQNINLFYHYFNVFFLNFQFPKK